MANPSEVRLTSGGAKERDEGLDLVGKDRKTMDGFPMGPSGKFTWEKC